LHFNRLPKLFDRVAVGVVLSQLALRCTEDRAMFPAAARFAGALVILSLAFGPARAQEEKDPKDPVHDGMKLSKWIDISQTGASARQRALAVEALGKIWTLHEPKTEVVPYINRALLRDTSAAVRAQAAIVLAGLRPKDVDLFSKALVEALGAEKESRVRKEILIAIAKFPDVCVLALDPLTAVLKDPDPAVKISAAECIATAAVRLKDGAKGAAANLVPMLKDEDKAVRIAAVFALGRIQPEGASTLADTMARMLGTEKDADIKRELVSSIGLLSEKSEVVLKALAAALFDTDNEVRRRAARVLGTFGTAAAPVADDLFKVLTTEKETDIRVDAIRAYGSALGPAEVKKRLKVILPQLEPAAQPAYEVRMALVEEVGALGWEHLGVDLMSPDKAVKDAAFEVIAALRKRLADPQVDVRKAAARAILAIEKKPEPKKQPDKKEPEKKEP
jgi:HEAT repeat protein